MPGKELTVTVVPHSGGGYGPGRSASIDTALPVAPAGFSVSGSTTSAALTWTPPTSASPVTGYTVIATPLVGAPVALAVSAAGLTFPVKVSGLARNTTYTFGVTATNVFGTGPASAKKLTGAVTTAMVTPAKVRYGQKIMVSGRVTNAETGKPLSGQTLYLYARTKGSTSYVSLGADQRRRRQLLPHVRAYGEP